MLLLIVYCRSEGATTRFICCMEVDHSNYDRCMIVIKSEVVSEIWKGGDS